jgi:4-amino-4-deoxy-L-arabinose transferase-like glycosyltransferase
MLSRWKIILLLAVCLFYWITRLPYIGGSYHVLEPDEAHYQILIDQIYAGTGWPEYQGELYLEQFPLFHILAAALQPVFQPVGVYAAARFLAMFSTFMAGLAIFWFGIKRNAYKTGLIGMAVFWQLPLVIFYSRSGTLDMLAIALILWATIIFSTNLKSKRMVFVAGFIWGLAVLSKTATLVYGVTFLLIWWTSNHRDIFRLGLLVVGLAAAVIPAFLMLSVVFGSSLAAAMLDMPSRHYLPLTNPRVHLAVMQLYIERFLWFFWLNIYSGSATAIFPAL